MAEAPPPPAALPPIPERLAGPRVRLAAYRPDDAVALWEAVEESRPRLERWLRWPREVHTPDEARARIARLGDRWAARERLAWGIFAADDRLLGEVAVVYLDWPARAFELGYWVRSGAEGRGIAREAVALVTHLLFAQLGATRVAIRVEAGNERSRRLAAGLGFVLEGRLRRERLGLDGHPTDTLVFALVPGDDLEAILQASGGRRGGDVSGEPMSSMARRRGTCRRKRSTCP